MKIMQIIPGTGGSFYCGNCLRDSKFVEALRRSEHQVTKIPMYLPLFSDEHDLTGEIPVFYGAISIYLKQRFPIFRKAPGWFDRMLNSKPMLKLASKMAGSTNAKGLEEMTISMLMGERGEQKEELDKMIDWMASNCQPDIIHLSNGLLVGLAAELKQRMNVPVVCSLQDEDQWVDVMKPEIQQKVWDLMAERGKAVDHFVAVSDFYGKQMQRLLKIPAEKLSSVHIGIYPEDYHFKLPSQKGRVIGYVSRMSYELGLDIVTDAFSILQKNPEFSDVELHITGGYTGEDRKYLHSVKRAIANESLSQKVHFHEDFEGEGLQEFLSRVSVCSVPVRKGEAFGIYLLEAMASGIPIVQPALGAFPEIASRSGGGVTYEPNTPEKLAEQLAQLLSSPQQLDEMAEAGRKGVAEHFHVDGQVKLMADIYTRLTR